jgi:hypothetical protein
LDRPQTKPRLKPGLIARIPIVRLTCSQPRRRGEETDVPLDGDLIMKFSDPFCT